MRSEGGKGLTTGDTYGRGYPRFSAAHSHRLMYELLVIAWSWSPLACRRLLAWARLHALRRGPA